MTRNARGSAVYRARAWDHALRWLAGLICAGLMACTAPHKLISARHTSCPVRKVEIRNLITQPQREDWIAVCGTQSYACSTREQGRRLLYDCHPLAASDAPDASVAEAADASAAAPVFAPDSGPQVAAADASAP